MRCAPIEPARCLRHRRDDDDSGAPTETGRGSVRACSIQAAPLQAHPRIQKSRSSARQAISSEPVHHLFPLLVFLRAALYPPHYSTLESLQLASHEDPSPAHPGAATGSQDWKRRTNQRSRCEQRPPKPWILPQRDAAEIYTASGLLVPYLLHPKTPGRLIMPRPTPAEPRVSHSADARVRTPPYPYSLWLPRLRPDPSTVQQARGGTHG